MFLKYPRNIQSFSYSFQHLIKVLSVSAAIAWSLKWESPNLTVQKPRSWRGRNTWQIIPQTITLRSCQRRQGTYWTNVSLSWQKNSASEHLRCPVTTPRPWRCLRTCCWRGGRWRRPDVTSILPYYVFQITQSSQYLVFIILI